MPETVVLLHGFGGTHRMWDGVAGRLEAERYRPLALDLPGHGAAADAERPITFAGCVEHVLARAPERFILGGYSLGGRVALHLALAAPQRVARLGLIACSAGIADAAERAERRRADAALAEVLEAGRLEEFIADWAEQPLFAGDPASVRGLAAADQRRNRPDALAAVLRGIGAGEMGPLWQRLPELEMPSVVVVGDRDAKFRALGRRMAGLLGDAELVLVSGGHRLALENPSAVARALQGLDPEAGSGR